MMRLLTKLGLLASITSAPQHTSALSLTNEGITRRDLFIGGAAAALPLTFPELVSANDNDAPIAVLGASGRTGALCVASCLRRGLPVKALTRSGNWPPPKIDLSSVGYTGDVSSDSLLTVSACDVKDANSLASSLAGCRAVIYAASASKSGGNSKEIDCDGVIAAGEACLKNNVGRYIVISSGSTTRPNSLGFKFTEMAVAGIMTNKRLGEVGVAQMYANNGKSSYVIIRPGGLDEPKVKTIQGPSALEISQGDVLAGFVNRADVAEVSVEMAMSSAQNVRNTAFELYYNNNVVPVDKKYRKYVNADDDVVKRLRGDTYQELFNGIKANYDYLEDP
jgi:nucleoside-diphosphate-sugar epimerase